METFKSNNPFLKVDPFKYNKEKKERKNIEKLMDIFQDVIKNKNMHELMDIQILINKRLKELT